MPAIDTVAARINELDAELETLQNADAPANEAEAETRSARVAELLTELRAETAKADEIRSIADARAAAKAAKPAVTNTGLVATRAKPAERAIDPVAKGLPVARCFDDATHAATVNRYVRSLAGVESRAASVHPMGSVDTVEPDSMGEDAAVYAGKGAELVAHELYRGIINEMGYSAITPGLASMYAVNTDGMYIPIAAEAPLAQWYVENQEIIPMLPGTSRATLTLKKMGTRVQVSNELIADAYINVGALVVSQIGQSFGRTLDNTYINGDGTAGIDGVAPTLGAYDSGSHVRSLAVNATITKDDLAWCVNTVDMNARNRRWIVSPEGWASIMGLATEVIGSSISNAVQAQVYGAPVTVTQYLPAGVHAIYGDFGMSTAVGYKPNGINVRASEDRAIEFDQTVFVGTARYAYAPHSMQFLTMLQDPAGPYSAGSVATLSADTLQKSTRSKSTT
jgi:HK97 family phage major capsid protein